MNFAPDFLDGHVFLVSSILSFRLFLHLLPSHMNYVGRNGIETSNLGLNVQGLTLSAAVGLCVCSHLLQEEVSQMVVHKAMIYEYHRKSLVVILSLHFLDQSCLDLPQVPELYSFCVLVTQAGLGMGSTPQSRP